VIVGNENIAGIFNIFHDGAISRADLIDEVLRLEIEISYLAERIDPSYTRFIAAFQNARDIEFSTWPRDRSAEPRKLTSILDIFVPEIESAPEILSAEVEDDRIAAVLSQDFQACDFSGGYLRFRADSAIVSDESGRLYTMLELEELCAGYWDEWEQSKTPSG